MRHNPSVRTRTLSAEVSVENEGFTAEAAPETASERAGDRRDAGDVDRHVPAIARAASHRTNLLTDRHELSNEQRTRIFNIYARGAAANLGLNASASTDAASVATEAGESVDLTSLSPAEAAAEVEAEVYEELAPEQQDRYVDEALDRDLWWSEVIGELEQDVDGETVAPAAAGAAGEPGEGNAPSAGDDTQEGDDAEETEPGDSSGADDSGTHTGGNLFDLLAS